MITFLQYENQVEFVEDIIDSRVTFADEKMKAARLCDCVSK